MKFSRIDVLKTAVGAFFVLQAVQPALAQSLPATNVSVKNSTTISRSVNFSNRTGVLTPVPTNPIPAGFTDIFTSRSSGSVDAAVLTYTGCRFNWSKIRQTSGIFTFSIGGTPISKCRANIVSSNSSTGAFSVKFDIRP
jgi:hypothetical protein